MYAPVETYFGIETQPLDQTIDNTLTVDIFFDQELDKCLQETGVSDRAHQQLEIRSSRDQLFFGALFEIRNT